MNGPEFEAEVLRVARHLWPTDVGGGAEFIDGRERDGVFYDEDVIHLVEATIERSEAKAKQDCKKLSRLAGDVRKSHQDKVVKCWFITLHEPTDRQRTVARAANYPIQAVGFKEFQGKLISARDYLALRDKHRFGSAANPDSQGQPPAFIPVEVKERSGLRLWSVNEVAKDILVSGRRFALTADFGAGKSMVLREIYATLKHLYLSGQASQFPVHINLREHSGAQYPDEILERHARIIGFPDHSKLVRAWKAGYAILILDGFDEITTRGFQGRWAKLRELRYRALSAVRELIHQQPVGVGLIAAGREYYFDSYSELRNCLSLTDAADLTLNEFTEEQVDRLLVSLGVSSTQVAPAWLPKRPLFLATLALKGYLADLRGEHYGSRGDGWNHLVKSICEREAKISVGLDSDTIRQVLERVATVARTRSEGQALSRSDLVQSYIDICGYEPDEEGLLLLERLPGLGIALSGGEARAFVDSDFECALGAGDVARYFVQPWAEDDIILQTVRPLTSVGVAVARSMLCDDARARSTKSALDRSIASSCLTYDILQVARELDSVVNEDVRITDLHIKHLDVSGGWRGSGKVFLSQCIVDLVDIDAASDFAEAVRLQGCMIQQLCGVPLAGDLPADLLDANCLVEEWSDKAASNAAILESSMSTPLKVLLVTLRKLYVQAGAARKENAFYRGLSPDAQRFVEDVLDILGSEGLASRDKRSSMPVISPNRSETKRVLSILAGPATSQDPLVVRVKSLA